ncbi:MAG: hypothetical protein KBI40_04105 [Firmicutes bacterium]|jgi:hypothetical protein|nr:hypothetical protein [Candidatus Fermentithermobacillaceae bacterium]
MSEYTREYPYEKTMVLNAVYDAVDTMNFLIDKANSMRGTLIISSASFPRIGGRVAISPDDTTGHTRVEIFPKCEDAPLLGWPCALLDEAEALLRQAGLEEDL